MKLKLILVTCFLFTSHAFGYSKSDITGSWTCSAKDTTSGAIVTSKDTYYQNGTSRSQGTMVMNIPNQKTLSVTMSSTGSWQLNGKTLTGKLSTIQVNSPQLPDFSKLLKQQARQNPISSSRIISLTKNNMVLRSTKHSITVNCRKISM